ncbi:hypothetical protein [Phenylobacterium sp.]|uniref:hypothetical protein n=1 Tax=Phenylobacterium sp. TaxID=1871053 RepID=UPI0028A09C9B|nr:hypothetical protein [Phenylobacterium sp.]
MSLADLMRLDDDARDIPEPIAPTRESRVFVRTLSTPPGLPWDQARTADLEARHGAPLPIADVLYLVRRLNAWRPGVPSRFAAFYVLIGDVGERLETTAEVDGKTVQVVFLAEEARRKQAQRLTSIALGCAVLVSLVTVAGATAFARSASLEAEIGAAELRHHAKLKAVREQRRLKEQARLLQGAPDRGARLQEALADIAWASAAKAPTSRIESLHWEPGLMAVEARGEDAPFVAAGDRQLERAKEPVRRGVWLWGVTSVKEANRP